jgi:hypothetical protein
MARMRGVLGFVSGERVRVGYVACELCGWTCYREDLGQARAAADVHAVLCPYARPRTPAATPSKRAA